jgi:hypothetical protein
MKIIQLSSFKIEYSFRYYIDDDSANDDGVSLDHWESKRAFDGVVSGGYGYRDPNGVIRNVYYRVEGDKGFEAIIKTVSPGGNFYFQQTHDNKDNHPPSQQQQPISPLRQAKPIAFLY